MSQIRLYLDEDAMRLALAQALKNAVVDVVTAADANNLSLADEEQLIWATEQNRVIYSFNIGDFSRLHTNFIEQNMVRGGIIMVTRQGYSIGEQLRGILRLINTKSAEEMINQLVFLGAYIRGS